MVAVNTLVVEIETSNGPGFGTEDRVFFDIGSRQWQLDNVGHNDFVAGQSDSFDLTINSPLDTSDIRKIRLVKSGFNGWQPRTITVTVNGAQVYSGPVNVWLDLGSGAEQFAGVVWEATDFPARFADRSVIVSHIVVMTVTGTHVNAGTDNRVLFSIGTREWQLNDPNLNDFEPGQTDWFVISNITNLRMHQIKEMGLRKTGRDGWRPESIMVWVNDEDMVAGPLYEGQVTDWLDGGAGADLRHGLKWVARDYPQPVPVATDPQADVGSVRVKITTGDGRYSQTDDEVYFDIGSREWLLDNPQRNDFENGRTDEFVLQAHAGLQRSDFRRIGLRKTGTNGWRPERVQVFLDDNTNPFYDGQADLFLDAGADARNKYGPAWTARDFHREVPVCCWYVIGNQDTTIRPNRSRVASAALIDNLNTAGYRTSAGSVNAIWSQGQLNFRVIDFRFASVADASAQLMPDVTNADFLALSNIAGNNNVADIVNIYFVRATATASNWFVPGQAAGLPPSVWVQDTRGGQAVNTRANFQRIVTSLSHELGHFMGLPHMCDNAVAVGDPCTAAEQANLMMGDGTDQTSVQLSIAEVQTAYANAAAFAE